MKLLRDLTYGVQMICVEAVFVTTFSKSNDWLPTPSQQNR